MTALVLAVALLQWVVVVAVSFFKRMPKSLLASTAILAVAYVNAFGVRHGGGASQAAALPQRSAGSCASLEPGMAADEVRSRMGQPHEVRDDGKTRGPGAVTWVYRDSRCAVHLLDEKVELIE
jgi:hypothetical protein